MGNSRLYEVYTRNGKSTFRKSDLFPLKLSFRKILHYLCHHHLRWVSQMHFFTVRSSCHAYLNFNVLLHFLKTFSQKKLQRVIRGSFTSSWRFRYSLMPFSLLRRLFLEFYFSWMRLMSSRCRARKPSKCTTRTELELFVNYTYFRKSRI